jgi:IstB-like ATP binding protein
VSPEKLTQSERKVFEQRERIASLIGGFPRKVENLKMSETMRPDFTTGSTTRGLWDEASNSIIILRKQLGSLPDFAGDSAAVTAMLDRLLHHGHILKCGPRSWRTKTDLPDQERMG